MIEKIMKSLKRGNKKRSLNITIGAVVGFLLSCTGVMGADNYLWIRENGNGIEFNTEKTADIDGEDGIWSRTHPYSDKNSWNTTTKTYINNMALLSSENNGKDNFNDNISYGLRLSGNLNGLNFINNSSITGTESYEGYGIRLEGNLGNLINNGNITGTGDVYYGEGIYLNNSSVIEGDITNSGSITGTGIFGEGISLDYNSTIKGDISNSGSITGAGDVGYGYGIYLYRSSTIKGNITNSGSITGTGSFGRGIYLGENSTIEGDIINRGRITGAGTDSSGYGIFLRESTIEGDINNSGSIVGTGTGDSGYGIYLENASTVKNIINSGSIAGIGTDSSGYGINLYDNSIIEGDITNSGRITGTGSVGSGYGIYLDNSSSIEKAITNSGSIAGTGHVSGYGIFLANKLSIDNSGSISGTGTSAASRSGHGYGIYLDKSSSAEVDIINSGRITGTDNTAAFVSTGVFGYGIYLDNSSSIKGDITNSGSISGTGSKYQGYGIRLTGTSGEIDITNNGRITATGYYAGYGILNDDSRLIVNINNSGIITGADNALYLKGNEEVSNYGILVAKIGTSVTEGTGKVKNNYGLYITRDSKLTIGSKQPTDSFGKPTDSIIMGVDEDGDKIKRYITIKNAAIKTGSSDKETDSFTFSSNPVEFNNSILNGKNNTLSVSDSNEIKGSVINAFGTAITFDNTAGGKLTLSGTVVNGGKDGNKTTAESSTITGSGNGDTLILQSGEIEYEVDKDTKKTGTQNTIINGNIDMGAGNDTLTIASGTIINGTASMGTGDDILTVGKGAIINGAIGMGGGDDIFTIETGGIINGTLDGGADNDTLNFNSALTRTSSNNEINILHNILGFENMNINTNITLFETTVGSDGKPTALKVTGADSITIGANGILTLRIDTARTDDSSGTDKITGHALYGNNGIIKSENGGKLLLALNGAGIDEIISFGETELDNSLITEHEGLPQRDVTLGTTSLFHSVERIGINEVKVAARWEIPEILKYEQLNKIYHGILSSNELGNFNVDDNEKLSLFLGYLNDTYAGNPYSYSSELSRKSVGMFRDIVTENIFRPETNKWMIYGGLTHIDGGTKDTYYGKGYYTYDMGSSNIEADTKITGAYMLGKYGVSDTLTAGVVIGGNKLKSDLSNDSKVDGDALYMGAYAKKYIGNLKVTAGMGFQYGDYDIDRITVNRVASSIGESVMKYSDNYNDMTYDIYLNGKYSHNIGNNLFLEPYGTLSYTYIDQDGADEGNKALAIETDSKSFDYTAAKVGVDLKKVIPHEKGKSTLSAGVSYTRILSGADEEYITGRFKSGSDFDILVAHKNEHSIGLNAKYALELENGILFDVKGTYAVERDSHNDSGKNKTKGEWIVGAGLGYKF